jgi:serine/threonine protein kinase
MFILQTLSALAIGPLVQGAAQAFGVQDLNDNTVDRGLDGVCKLLSDQFVDHSQRLTRALHQANERAWRTLEVALAGESLWSRLTSKAEDKAFREQVRKFLDARPLTALAGKDTEFRNAALQQLRSARSGGLLGGQGSEPQDLARQGGHLARFGDPTQRLDAEWVAVAQIAAEIRQAGHIALADLLVVRPTANEPALLVLAVRYFFRRAVENDRALFQGLTFARMEAMAQMHTEAYDALHLAISANDLQLEEGLAAIEETIRTELTKLGKRVDGAVERVHQDYLDLRAEQQQVGTEMRKLHQDVLAALEQHRMERRDLQPRDSLSFRNDAERQLIKQLVARYRALPESERNRVPALLNALGKLEVVAGDYDNAQRDFQQAAAIVSEPKARAEALYNGYRAALERRDFSTALLKLRAAAQLDTARYAPFPQDKYEPVRILGAGGFGVAFLCRHRYMDGQVVIKSLMHDDLDRGVDVVFAEAKHLQQLNDPAIIRIQDCGFADPASTARPYLVMDHFDGMTLEDHVQTHGPLAPEELCDLAWRVARGLRAAHDKGILHRDVKPANLLVRRQDSERGASRPRWDARVIDFGLALQQQTVLKVARSNDSIMGRVVAGTLDYAAPEQMGKVPGVPVGFYSDVYGFGKTCCYALFRTPQPTFEQYERVGRPLAKLLSRCLDTEPRSRLPHFGAVLQELERLPPIERAPARRESSDTDVIQRTPPPPLPRERSPRESEPLLEAIPVGAGREGRSSPPLPRREEDRRPNRADEPSHCARTHSGCTVVMGRDVIRAEYRLWSGEANIFYNEKPVTGGKVLGDETFRFNVTENGEQVRYEVSIRPASFSLMWKPYFTFRRNGRVIYNDR